MRLGMPSFIYNYVNKCFISYIYRYLYNGLTSRWRGVGCVGLEYSLFLLKLFGVLFVYGRKGGRGEKKGKDGKEGRGEKKGKEGGKGRKERKRRREGEKRKEKMERREGRKERKRRREGEKRKEKKERREGRGQEENKKWKKKLGYRCDYIRDNIYYYYYHYYY